MRDIKREFLLCSILVLIESFLIAKPNIEKGEQHNQETELSHLQGVWQQIGLQDSTGKFEDLKPKQFEFLKVVMVINGSNTYTIRSNALGVGVAIHRLSLGQNGELRTIELIDPDNNYTIRSLYELDNKGLTLCYHGGGKTLLRPQKIAPTIDGFIVHRHKKLTFPAKRIVDGQIQKENKALKGLWRTDEFERNAKRFNDQGGIEATIEFWENQHVFYFHDNVCLQFSTDDHDLRIENQSYQIMPKDGQHAIDFRRENGKSAPAIYQWEGERLTICWNDRGGKRPDQFRTQEGDGRLLMRLKRVDKDQ